MDLSTVKEKFAFLYGKNRKKSLSFLIALFLLLALGFTIFLVQKRQLLEKKAAGENSRLTLPDNLTASPGEEISVPVYLDTDSADISGVDVVLDFLADKDKLTLVSIQPDAQAGSTLKTFTPVDADGVFDTTTVVNKANSTGIVEFGAVTYDWSQGQPTNPFNEVLDPNPLATLTFQVNPGVVGSTQAMIKVVHTPGVTTDSNLVSSDSVTDILALTNSLAVSISAQPLSLSPGWNEVVWSADAVGKKASDVPSVCPLTVVRESFWFRPYVRTFGGPNFNFENNRTYYLWCHQATLWQL